MLLLDESFFTMIFLISSKNRTGVILIPAGRLPPDHPRYDGVEALSFTKKNLYAMKLPRSIQECYARILYRKNKDMVCAVPSAFIPSASFPSFSERFWLTKSTPFSVSKFLFSGFWG